MAAIVGKIIGGGLGLALGGPLGAFVGAALGHAVDMNIGHLSLFDASAAQQSFFQALFLIMGHIAKADGRVSEREIQVAQQVMQRMQLDAQQRQVAIKLFNRGKRSEFSLDMTLSELNRSCGAQPQLFRLLIEVQLDAGYADGRLSHQAHRIIEKCGLALGIPGSELDQMVDRRRGGYRRSANAGRFENPYEVLGLPRGSDDKTVKQAYRRLTSQNHPDKLVSKGLPREMLELAKQKTTEIRAAYDQIRAERGL